MGSSPSAQEIKLNATVVKTAFTQISNTQNQKFESANLKLYNSNENNFTQEMLARDAITSRNKRDAAKIISSHAEYLMRNDIMFEQKTIDQSLIKSIYTLLFATNYFKSDHLNKLISIIEQKFGRQQPNKEEVDDDVRKLLEIEITNQDLLEFIETCKNGGKQTFDGEDDLNKQIAMM